MTCSPAPRSCEASKAGFGGDLPRLKAIAQISHLQEETTFGCSLGRKKQRLGVMNLEVASPPRCYPGP